MTPSAVYPANRWDVLGLCGGPGEPPCPNFEVPDDWVYNPDDAATELRRRRGIGDHGQSAAAAMARHFAWVMDQIAKRMREDNGARGHGKRVRPIRPNWGTGDTTFGLPTAGLRREISVQEYWTIWIGENPNRDVSVDRLRQKYGLLRGCVGVTCLNLGEYFFPDTSNCFRTRAQAEARLAEMREAGGCKGLNPNKDPAGPRLFSIHLWNDGYDVIQDSSGKVDLGAWDKSGRPPGDWNGDGVVDESEEGGGYNYDYGWVTSTGEIIHANHQDGLNGAPMKVYISDAAEWAESNADFNEEVWCVACDTDKF